MTIKAENLTWKIGQTAIVDGVSLKVEPGKMLGLLGPNGSGKSSLLRLLAGLRKAHAGSVTLGGKDMRAMRRGAIARRVALVEQHASTEANVKVRDVVKLGRIPHHPPLGGWTRKDDEAVDTALDKVGMGEHRERFWQSLSGGERQRVHIARALAQAPTEMLLDEPTNHLDIQHQIELLRLISDLSLTSVIAMHDLNHAAMFCDHVVVLQQGRVVAHGTPEEVLTRHLLREIFHVETVVQTSPHHGKPHIHYMR